MSRATSGPARSLLGKRRSSEANDTHNFTISQYSQHVRDNDEPEPGYRLFFVLLDGDSNQTCSSRLSTAFQVGTYLQIYFFS